MYLNNNSINAFDIDELIAHNQIYYGSIEHDAECYNTLWLAQQYLENVIKYYTKLNDIKSIKLYQKVLNELNKTMDLMP